MGFHAYSSPYDWGRVQEFKQTAGKFEGGIIDLSVGSPVDDVPSKVCTTLANAANNANAHGYPATAGSVDLRTAIADWFLHCRNIDIRAIGASVLPTVGSKEAVALMPSFLHLGKGDIVVQPKVSYPTYEIGTQLAGAEVLKVDDIADVESWKHVPCVKAVWVNSPSNPTGEVLSSAQITSIIQAAREIGAVVLSDECYALMNWGEPAPVAKAADPTDLTDRGGATASADLPFEDFDIAPVPASAPSALSSNICCNKSKGVIVLYSLSKQSNMAGYRTAFIAGDSEIIAEMTEYRKQIGQIIPGPIQAAMVSALRDTQSVHEQWLRYRSRLSRLVSGLRAFGYQAQMPQGALYVWVEAKSGNCWQDLADLAQLGIVASPGEFYGDSRYLRLSATAADAEIDEVVRRLS